MGDIVHPLVDILDFAFFAEAVQSIRIKNGNIDAAGIASTAAGFTAIVDSAKGQGVDIPLDKSPSLSG